MNESDLKLLSTLDKLPDNLSPELLEIINTARKSNCYAFRIFDDRICALDNWDGTGEPKNYIKRKG